MKRLPCQAPEVFGACTDGGMEGVIFSWPWSLEAWDLIIIIVPLQSCREFMSIKSMAESFLFSIEDYQWVFKVTLRFPMHTHRHTGLSLWHPQARGRQLIHLKACKQHFFFSWMKCSGIHSSLSSAKLRGKFLNHILLLFPRVKSLRLLHVRHSFPVPPFFCERFFLISELLVDLFWRLVQCGRSPSWAAWGEGLPPHSQATFILTWSLLPYSTVICLCYFPISSPWIC